MQPGAGSGGAQSGGTGDDEAPKDPGARITHQSYTEKDYEGKKCSPDSNIFLKLMRVNTNRNHQIFFYLY